MNIVLITPTPPDINAFGVRTLSSVLKKEGVKTKIVFLPGGIEHLKFDSSFIYQYKDKTLDQIAALCKDADLIGFSFFSQYYDRAAQVTAHLKKTYPAIPVIWGGIHPTYRPEQCLELADMVCIGEGEYALIELAKKIAAKADYTDVRGCWFRKDGSVIKNDPAAIVQNLDELPFVDYDLDGHYAFNWRTDDLDKLDVETMQEHFPKLHYYKDTYLTAYRTMTSRGCPHKCSYCASSATMRLRRRSVDNVLDELEQVRKRFPYIEIIHFFDDTFFAAPDSYFQEFSAKYKQRINLPFHAQASPTTLNRKKLELLLDAGLCYTEMGIQTGSERIKQMYRRVVPNETMIEAARLIDSYRGRLLTPDYHVILDNPWETNEDVIATLRLLLDLPGKFKLQISSLIFFPGTELNKKAQDEGLIKDELNEVCRKPFTFPKGTYLNYLIYLSGYPVVPRRLLRFLSKGVFVKLFQWKNPSRFYVLLFAATVRVRLVMKGIAALARGDFKRIFHFFKLAR